MIDEFIQVGQEDAVDALRRVRPYEDGAVVRVGSQPSTYQWNALLGAWVKTSGDGPNFVTPKQPPEADHGDHHD
jgi:hypothetical protein